MSLNSLPKQKKIGKNNYNIIYRGKIPVVLSLRTGKDRRLLTDKDKIYEQTKQWALNPKPRCPYCFRIRKIDLGNKRESWELGNNPPVLSSKVDLGAGQEPRVIETSKWCQYCERTFIKNKVVVQEY